MKSTQDLEIRSETVPVSLRLLDLVMGSWRSGVVSTFAELCVADAFHSETITPTQLAFRLGLEPDICDRFCRAAIGVGLLTAPGHGTLALTDLGAALATGSPDSMQNFARWSGSTADRATWAKLGTAVRTGRSPFAALHGSDVWDFLDSHPDTSAVFNAAMTELSRNVIGPVVDAMDFSGYTRVTDVGGGRGALLARILQVNPHLTGVLFDQPDVLNRA
ncbi:MAG: methyltransferase, partial [Angustibacter sp.]